MSKMLASSSLWNDDMYLTADPVCRDPDALLPIITEAESVAAQVAAIKAVTCCAALQSHARKTKHSPNGALLNVSPPGFSPLTALYFC